MVKVASATRPRCLPRPVDLSRATLDRFVEGNVTRVCGARRAACRLHAVDIARCRVERRLVLLRLASIAVVE
jgi:hypothetical protein